LTFFRSVVSVRVINRKEIIMKNIVSIWAVCAVVGLGAGCDSGGGGNGGSRIDESGLPDPARTFLEQTFPGEDIRFAERTGAGFEVIMASGVEVEFDASGNWTEVDGLGRPLPERVLGIVPARAVAYARSNFDSPIVEIEIEPYGFDLTLASGPSIEFAPDGNVLRVD
jgi:hypothetical protein